jgi:hypothetical protein
MPKRRCCPECFGDRGLRDSIFPQLGTASGTCDYCGSTGVCLVEPALLREAFELVTSPYHPDSNGSPLTELLVSDWNLFSHPKMDDAHAKELLADVFDDGDLVRKNFSPIEAIPSDSLGQWEKLRTEMMHRNRWFPAEPVDLPRLRGLLDQIITESDSIADRWYRARLMSGDRAFPLEEMGAPPAHLAGHGRANPAGIPYLYLGSDPNTAISEVRPHTGERATIARFELPELKLVDVRDPRTLVSPFLLDDSEVTKLRQDLPLLERLGEELTRPVIPSGAPFEYIPSQYLCEFMKQSGFDGVAYRSSVGQGVNVAVFNPSVARAIDLEEATVTAVTVEIGMTALAP